MRARKIAPYVFYAVVALLILGPLLKPGYIFTLDNVTGPHYKLNLDYATVSGLPVSVFIFLIGKILPAWLVQKLLFFVCLFAAGAAMHAKAPVDDWRARLFAGFFYMVNPFVFARLQAGHTNLLLVYALAPLAVSVILSFLSKPSGKRGAVAALWLAFLVFLDLHALYLWLVPVFGLPFYLWLNAGVKTSRIDIVKPLITFIGVFVLATSLWLIPASLAVSGAASSPVTGIDSRQIASFATKSDPLFGVYFNVAALNGFWQDQVYESKRSVSLWPAFFLALFALSVWGLWRALDEDRLRPAALTIAAAAAAACVLALGTSSPMTAGIYRFLFDNIPFFRGFREPQKFAAFLAFAYAYLGSVGLGDILQKVEGGRRDYARKTAAMLLALTAVISVAVYTYPLFWGLSGHVKASDYPRSWYRAEKVMSADKTPGQALFLPWHQYLGLSFNAKEKVVVNPAPLFFSRVVISGENMELGKVYSTSNDPVQRRVEGLLADGRKGKEISRGLRSLKIRYVVLAKEGDWWKYKWLYSQKELPKSFETSQIVLFKIAS